MEAPADNYVDALSRLALFADLTHPQLEVLAHSFDEEIFAAAQRVIRQEVTGGPCHKIVAELIAAAQWFIAAINRDPLAVVGRLRPKFEFDPELENKLRVSF